MDGNLIRVLCTLNGSSAPFGERRVKRAVYVDDTVSAAPITPEALSGLLQVKVPSGSVAVQGIAQDVRPYAKDGTIVKVYGRLALGGFSIRIATPPQAAPQEGEAVIVKGTLGIRPTKPEHEWRATHEVMLTGHVISNWTPRTTSEGVTDIPSRDEVLPFQNFVDRYDLSELVVLCTGTAERDITASLHQAGIYERPRFEYASFASEPAFLTTLSGLLDDGDFQGIAVARGGGAGIEEIGNSRAIAKALVSSGLPFYTAIGHDTNVVLLDKLADQAFHTPSALAAAWGHAQRERTKRKILRREMDEMQARVAQHSNTALELRQQLADLQSRLGRAVSAHRWGLSFSWGTLVVIISATGLAVWLKLKFFP